MLKPSFKDQEQSELLEILNKVLIFWIDKSES
jgi:hypothetical protein